jgi:predicted nucleotidyltransferase
MDQQAGTSRILAVIPGIPPEAKERLLAVLNRHPLVQEVWLYGSRAMGTFRPGSDIDLTVKGEGLRHDDLVGWMVAIDDLLLPWTVDVSLYRELPPELRQHVKRVGRRLM